MQLKKGQMAIDFSINDIFDKPLNLENLKGKKNLLSFMRNTACPFCNFRIFHLNNRFEEYQSKGLEAIVFFESSREVIMESPFLREQKIRLISDPTKRIYRQYGVTDKLAEPRSDATQQKINKATLQLNEMGIELVPDPEATDELIPADFLIRPDLIIYEADYGQNIGNNIAFEQIDTFLAI